MPLSAVERQLHKLEVAGSSPAGAMGASTAVSCEVASPERSTLLAMTQMEERERTVSEISEAEKVEFLQMIGQGLNRQEAAKGLDYKARHFRSLCSPRSPFYDEDFAQSYGEAVGSLEHAEGRLERLRAEAQRRALTDSDRLLEKMLLVYDPDWAVLRQKEVNVSVNVLVQRVFKDLPVERLEQILVWLDEQEGQTIEAADFEALPPAGNG